MVLTADVRPLASGVLIHSGEHATCLDRAKEPWELLSRTRGMIPAATPEACGIRCERALSDQGHAS